MIGVGHDSIVIGSSVRRRTRHGDGMHLGVRDGGRQDGVERPRKRVVVLVGPEPGGQGNYGTGKKGTGEPEISAVVGEVERTDRRTFHSGGKTFGRGGSDERGGERLGNVKQRKKS